MTASATNLRPVPGPSIGADPSLESECERWAGLHDMIAKLEEQAREIADRIIEAAGDERRVEWTDATGERRAVTVVRVPIRTFDRAALEAALPKPVYRSILADPTIDRDRLAAAVKLGQVDPVVLAEATTTTFRRPFLRIGSVKR